MSDFELFAEQWERAVNGLCGRVINEKDSKKLLYSQQEMNDMWQEELMTHRFCSVGLRDEAKLFLDDLFTRRPDVASQVLEKLQKSSLNVGLKTEKTAIEGALTAVGGAVALSTLTNPEAGALRKLIGVLGAAGGLASAGAAVADVASSAKQTITRSIREQARKQLEEYRAILSE